MTIGSRDPERSTLGRRFPVVLLLLLALWLRLCCLDGVPPGWRDDELINIHALSGELLEGSFLLYFTGASGHEPLYHWLHAGVHAVLGFNVLSGHLLSAALGVLTISLTYALARRLFGFPVAIGAMLAMVPSFWSLMYSRTAIRHIILPPFVLAILVLAPVLGGGSGGRRRRMVRWGLVGVLLGVALYTYPAARLLPVALLLLVAYTTFFHRQRSGRHWRGFLLALGVMAVIVAPMLVAVARGRSDAAAQGIGADARLDELAVPLRELWDGNPRPLIEGVWTTLGMFHATGDHEWLYNLPGRPVFNLLGGALFWAGIVLCLWRWRRPRYFALLLWLGLGLLPAFVSTPPASLSHTILAQPVAYILPILPLDAAYRRMQAWRPGSRASRPDVRWVGRVVVSLLFVAFLVSNGVRDLYDYFVSWPQQEEVRFLYRADYRDAARYLDDHTEVTDVAISSLLMGPWDRLALDVDMRREDVAVRLFNPERALVWVAGDGPTTTFLASWPPPGWPIDEMLESEGPPWAATTALALYSLGDDALSWADGSPIRFANGLVLTGVRPFEDAPSGQEVALLTVWLVAVPLDLPPVPIVANPPPPGVATGPRLAVFTHLLTADGTLAGGDDGLWVDPHTLCPGDRFVQVHRFLVDEDAAYTLELGLYDPRTGDRWPVLDSAGQPVDDHVLLADVMGRAW